MSSGKPRPLDDETARAALKAAYAAVTADDVRVNIYAEETGFSRYAVNEITTAGQIIDVETTVTCAVGAKHASVTLHGLRPDDVAAAARRALEQARIAPDDPEWVPSPGPATMKPVMTGWSDAPVSAADRAALVADSITEGKKQGLTAYGFIHSQRATEVTGTRAGFFGIHHATSIGMTTTARTPDGAGSGWASAAGIALADVDALAASRIACDKALRSRGAKPLEPGVYPVVLEPAAVAAMLRFIDLDMRDADEGHSPFTKPGGGTRIGEKLFGALTLKSDPWSSLQPTAPFDDEGMVRPPVTWVENGVLKKLRTTRYWAKKTNRAADASYRLMLPAGPAPQPTESLIAGLDKGLVVTRLWYLRMLEPQTITVTGLTRDGVFLVENGKVVGPVNNFRFNQSVLQMCANSDAWGPPVRVVSGEGEGGPPDVAPALRCKAFRMASRSDAV